MSAFNEDQRDYMRSLAAIPREQRCECGWDTRGDCFGSCYGDEAKGGAERHGDECDRNTTDPRYHSECTCGATARYVERSKARRVARTAAPASAALVLALVPLSGLVAGWAR